MKTNPIKDKTFQYALSIIRSYKILHSDNEFVLSRQLLKSGTAPGALVREALNAESKSDFIHKMGIAQKECDESMYWIELLAASEMIPGDIAEPLHADANEILRMIRSIILTSKKNLSQERADKKKPRTDL